MPNEIHIVALVYLVIAAVTFGFAFHSFLVFLGVGFTLAFFQKLLDGITTTLKNK